MVNLSEPSISPEAQVRKLLECLYAMSPAFNEITQFLFLLPQKATTIMKIYPELMEREDELIELFGLRYTDRGFIWSHESQLGGLISSIYHALFKVLSDPNLRAILLKLAGLSEEEFRNIDPLRAWIEVSLEFLVKVSKDSLKLLNVIVNMLETKGPGEGTSLENVKSAAESAGVRDFAGAFTLLRNFRLLQPSSAHYIYKRECVLLVDVYSDLRRKLAELVK